MNILFTTLNSKFIHSNLAIKYLSKCCDRLNTNTKEYTINEDIENILYDILDKGYDTVAFSCYIWNIEKTLKIASNIKKASPETLIIFGGPEVSFEVQDFMQQNKFVDMVVCGEGEQAFSEFQKISLREKTTSSKDFLVKNKSSLLKIFNLYFRIDEEVYNVATEKELEMSMVMADLSTVPSAYDKFSDIENKIVYYETSRGCTFNCSYCLSATGKGIRYFDEKRVYFELAELVKLGAKQIKFVDRTFNADSKRASRLVEYLMSIDDGKINFHFEITAYLLQDELLKIIEKARVGLFQFEIGVQSTNEKTLLAVHRGNQFDKLRENVEKIKSYGNIHQHLDLIAGLPFENMESFKKSFNQVFSLKPDALQLGFLKMLKGSPIFYQEEEFGYVYRNYPPYEVIANKFMSATDFIKLKKVENILDRYYNTMRYKNSINYLYRFFENAYDFFENLSNSIEENAIDLSKKNEEFYGLYLFAKNSVLQDFNIEFFTELLRFDYLMMGRNPNVPDFLKAEQIASKEEIFEILKEEDTLKKLRFGEDISPKEAFKKIQWSNFEYDVTAYILETESHDKMLIKSQNIVIINYDYERKGDEPFAVIRKYV